MNIRYHSCKMKCPKCGFDNAAGLKFCGECGAPLAPAAEAPEERRSITILFADLSGFTALSHRLDPEDVSDAVNICFEHINPIIVRHGGLIHKYEGDLVIALFGVPVAHEDDPEQAVRSSLEMLEIVPRINRALAERLKLKTDIDVHVGINCGLVALRQMGTAEKKEWTMMGDAVNLASRLKDAAKRGETIVSEPVFKAARYLFEFEARPPVVLKGITEPVGIYKPLRIKEKPDPKRGIKGLYSPLVGRQKDLEMLKQRIFELRKGRGGAVFILGDAGLGKSRLYQEIKELIANDRLAVTVLEGHCASYGEKLPNWPILQLIRSVFDIKDNDGEETVRRKITSKSREILPTEWQKTAPYIAQLFSVRFEGKIGEQIRYLGPQAIRQRILKSVGGLFSSLAGQGPLILAIDDYHWIDPASLELLEFMFDGGKVPFLFIALSRIEKNKECWRAKERIKRKAGRDYQEVLLQPLDEAASAELTQNLLKISGIPGDTREKILAKAEGNPFYIEEIIRSLIDTNALVLESGVWHLTSEIGSLEIPDTVQAIIASRLDRLEKDIRDILQMASVMGRNFYERVLEYLSGLDGLVLSLHLTTLEEFEYIKKAGLEPGPGPGENGGIRRMYKPEIEYIFKHPLIQEVVYNGLLKKKRRELHRKVGECIEKMFADRIDDFVELLSLQYERAEDWEKSYHFSVRSAEKAIRTFLNKEALYFFDRAIKSIRQAASAGGNAGTSREIAAMEGKARVLHIMGRNDEAQAEIRSGIAIAEANNDRKSEADCLLRLSDIYIARGRFQEVLTVLDKALRLYQKIRDREGEAHTLNNIGIVLSNMGKFRKALVYYERSLEIKYRTGDLRGQAQSLHNIGTVNDKLGEHGKALDYYTRAMRIEERYDELYLQGYTLNAIGVMHNAQGSYKLALDFLNRSLRIREKVGDRRGAGHCLNTTGIIHRNLGNYERALEDLGKAMEIFEEIGERPGQAHYSLNMGILCLEKKKYAAAEKHLARAERIAGELKMKDLLRRVEVSRAELLLAEGAGNGMAAARKAKVRAQRAMNLAEELKTKSGRAEALLLQARIEAAEGKGQRAGMKFCGALKLLEGLKQPLETAKAYYHYGQILRRHGETGDGDSYLKKAKAILERIGARGWLEKIAENDKKTGRRHRSRA